MKKEQKDLEEKIKKLIRKHFLISQKEKKFIPGKSFVQYAGAVYDEEELNEMVSVMLKGWFGLGKQGELLERELASYMGVKKAYLTNSGSSADLLALSSLMSYQFSERMNRGDEVVTPACTFPTVVSSLMHCNLKPVFVDVDPETLNPRPEDIERAITKKTRLIFLVHTLGNPNDMNPIMDIAKEKKLFVVEDNCDSLGSLYNGRKTGSFGILSTESFYPAHHITTAGEGGAVFLNDLRLLRIVSSLREWGRACWCGASGGGKHGMCKVRFKHKIDGLPYDHKYIFSHAGYNLKPVEIQAAMGRMQLKKLPFFIKRRRENFSKYFKFFKDYEKYFILPKSLTLSDPSWFAFPLTIRDNVPFNRFQITTYLEKHKIQTRPIFAGNILRQPGFRNIEHNVSGSLSNSDKIFLNSFFVGVYPGILDAHLDYVTSIFKKFFKSFK